MLSRQGGNIGGGRPAPRTAGGAGRRAPARAPRSGSNRAAGAAGGTRQANAGLLQFYTDDAPGFKVEPTHVLVGSVVFIGLVIMLHIWGKITG